MQILNSIIVCEEFCMLTSCLHEHPLSSESVPEEEKSLNIVHRLQDKRCEEKEVKKLQDYFCQKERHFNAPVLNIQIQTFL